MTDTPNPGETVVVEQVKNDAQATQSTSTTTAAEIEAARKRAEQAEMRANQLANQIAEREKADEIARQKQLEENNEFKTLYEREKAQREEMERQQEEASRSAQLANAKSAVFAEYPVEVVEVAEAAGLALSDDSEEAKAALKEKLEVIKSKVVTSQPAKVVGNNGVQPVSSEDADHALLVQRMRYDDKTIADEARRTAISKIPGLAEMKKIAGVSE